MKKLISLVFVFTLMLGATNLYAAPHRPVMELEGVFWMPSLNAKAKVEKNGLGTEIDFSDDLGVKDEDFTEFRLGVNITSSSKLRFAFSQVNYNGDKQVTRDYIFNGKTYTAGSQVTTKLDMDYLRLGLFTNFSKSSNGNEFGTLFELKGFSGNAMLQANSLGLNENEDFDIILPTLGLFFKTKLAPTLFIYGEFSGLPAGSLGYLLDGEAGLRFQPTDNLAICAGYRILNIDAEKDEDYAEIKTDGAFISAVISY